MSASHRRPSDEVEWRGESGGEAEGAMSEAAPFPADATALARYQDLFAHMAEGVVFQDADGRIVDANAAALHLLGLTREQLLDLTAFDPRWRAIHLDGTELPGAMHPSVVALRSGQAVRDAIMGVFIPGEERYRWMRVNAIPRLIPGRERPIGVFVTFDDITEWDYLKETARIQEARYQALLEQAVDAVFVADLDGRYIEVNPAACALLGYTREELLGMRIVDLILPEEVPRLEASRGELLRGETERSEWQLRRKDGLLVPVEISTRMMPDGRWQAIVRDITRRKRMEEELRQAQRASAAAEARFRAVIEQSPDALITIDAHGRIVLVNRQTELLFGYDRGTLLGKPIERLIPKRLHALHRMHRAVYAAHPQVRLMGASQELSGRRADGTEFPVEISLAPIADNGSVHIIATCRDITARKQMERMVRAQSEQLALTFEAMHEGVYIYDRTGELVQMNAVARALAGYDVHPEVERETTEERLSRLQARDSAGSPIHEEDWPVRRVLRGEIISTSAPIEMSVTSATGREVFLQVTGAPLHDADGKVTGAVVVTRDVTEQRRLEQQRMDIFRVVTHDLANPLAALKMYLQLQQRKIERESSPVSVDPESLETMIYEVVRMERLLGDMHIVGGVASNGLALDRKPFDLVALCQQEARSMQVAETRDLRVTLPDEPVMVLADRDRIGQVMGNLLSNADKYSPITEPIYLTVRLERGAPASASASGADGAAAGQARVLVQDVGPGIPKQEQERIWERFHRVPGIRVQGGTGASLGLGLYICRQIIEQHGGAIGVESAPGAGSTFWFTLPLAPSSPTSPPT